MRRVGLSRTTSTASTWLSIQTKTTVTFVRPRGRSTTPFRRRWRAQPCQTLPNNHRWRMLSPDDIQRLCERRYPGFLRSIVTGEEFFPLRVAFGRPSGSDEWARLQAEISALAGATMGYRIDWEEINTRRWGRQRLPARVSFE